MHPFELNPEAMARVTAKLGRPFMIERLEPSRTALIVVDMQNYFMAPGQQFETPTAREIVPAVNLLAAGLRAAGGTVVWIENLAPEDSAREWPTYSARYSPAGWARRDRSLKPDDTGFQLWPALDVQSTDLRVRKTRFSAFIQGASTLEQLLRAAAIDTLLITGVATNICCESTARDAMMLNFKVIMVSDACAAPSDALHAASLNGFYEFFGDVRTSADLLKMLSLAQAA
ncbi:MAG: cysteine hydrolase [Gammaproteobacteria bacterium]|nr:cysteine hydrolase [Gammaproteobacteria bacterium]